MLRTILDGNLTTIGTDQLFGIELSYIMSFVHRISTILASSKIRLLAFKTLKISIDSHRINLGFLIVR